MFTIEKATVSQAKAKIALIGPAGAGKTYTSLVTAQELGSKIIVLDTENKSSAKFADQFNFDIIRMPDYRIQTYIEGLNYVAGQGYDVVIVDSLSHAWAGEGGALEQAEQAASRYGGNKFAGWADVTPLQNRLVNTILTYPTHLIATLRMKIEYALVTDERGKQKPQKLGLGIIQRDSFEYEFDIIGQLDVDHNLTITKTRCFALDGFMAKKPDGEMGKTIKAWLEGGEPVKMFNSLDDLLFQINLDFGLAEKGAKEKIKDLGFNSIPRDEASARKRFTEIYTAVREAMDMDIQETNGDTKPMFEGIEREGEPF